MLKLSHGGKAFRNYEIKARPRAARGRAASAPRGALAPRCAAHVWRQALASPWAPPNARTRLACRRRLQEGGRVITVEPGLIGGEVNRLLANYAKKHQLADKYKIGPDPSSIDSCMMGGIVANNSSGMCCGVAQARDACARARARVLRRGGRAAQRHAHAAPRAQRATRARSISRVVPCASLACAHPERAVACAPLTCHGFARLATRRPRAPVAQNTFHTLRDMRVVFADGTLLDTSDPASREAFKRSHAKLLKVRHLFRRSGGDARRAGAPSARGDVVPRGCPRWALRARGALLETSP